MLYSWMSLDNNGFISLYAEQMLQIFSEAGQKAAGKGPVSEALDLKTMKRIAGAELAADRLFIKCAHIHAMEEGVPELFFDIIAALHCTGTEVYLTRVCEEMSQILTKRLEKAGVAYSVKRETEKEWCIRVVPEQKAAITMEQAEALIREIHKDNLLILVEDGAKGKQLNIRRLLQDEEYCLYYFFYRLAMKLIREGLIPEEEKARERICLAADGEQAACMVKYLARLLHVKAEGRKLLKEEVEKKQDYIIVRDVVHMACEMDGVRALISRAGARVVGAACLLDIHTGIGARGKIVSLYTINLEKGIRRRLNFYGQKGDF